jgi:N-acetylmuramoyl-L-alanine amidase
MRILQAIPAETFRAMPWANGCGTTTELAAGPDPKAWRWRISLARIEQDGDFSALPGVRRQLAPLDGALRLDFSDGRRLHAQRLQVLHFDGDPAPACHSPDGPGRDFNLMLRDGMEGELLPRPLMGSMVLLPRANTRWFVYMLAGQAIVHAGSEQLALGHGEAAWALPPSDTRVVIDGSGEVVLVRLNDPAAAVALVDPGSTKPLAVRDWPLPYAAHLPRRERADIDLVVIHCTELPDLAMAREYGEKVLYQDGSGNSGHYYIDRDGSVLCFVDIDRVAHHVRGYNPRSIGIELVNSGRYPDWLDSRHQHMTEPYTAVQLGALRALLARLQRDLPALRFIAGHEDLDTAKVPASDDPAMTVRRKRDPGPLFPWEDILHGCDLQRLDTAGTEPSA